MIWHYLIAAVLIISLIAVTNPWMILMPSVMGMVALVVIAIGEAIGLSILRIAGPM